MATGPYINEKPQTEDRKKEDTSIQNAEEKEVKRSFCGKVVYVLRNITVEPCLGVYMMAYLITTLTIQNLTLDKACRINFNFSTEICDALRVQGLESQNIYELQTQKVLAQFLGYRTYITATIPSLLALFIGAWSDKTGHRKIFIMIPLVGQILAGISNILNVVFFYQLSIEYLIFTDALLEGLTGGLSIVIITAFSFMSSITTVEDRTFRLGLLGWAFTLGFPIGQGLSGILLKNFGYYMCFGMAIGMHTLNLLYTIFLLKDPKRNQEQKSHDKRGVIHICRTFFDFKNILGTIQVVFKDGPNNRRMRMCIFLVVLSILFGPLYGEVSVIYMNTRFRFNWDEVQFGLFQTYSSITNTIGVVFSIGVFNKRLHWHDSMLGILSTISKIAASFVYCFAPNGRIFYIAPLVEFLNGTASLALRSLVSKIVAPDEFGKMNSIFGLTENLMPLLYVPLYTNVYQATMETLPGAIFLMGAAMVLPALSFFCWLFYEHRRGVRRLRQEKKSDVALSL